MARNSGTEKDGFDESDRPQSGDSFRPTGGRMRWGRRWQGWRTPPNPKGPQNFASRGAMGWIILAGLGGVMLFLITNVQNQAEKKSWQQFLNYAQGQWFDGPVVVEDERIVGKLKTDTPGLRKDQKQPHRVSLLD